MDIQYLRLGDRVIWLYSGKRSFMVGLNVQRIPGEVVRINRRGIGLKVLLPGEERLVNVSPDNVIGRKES